MGNIELLKQTGLFSGLSDVDLGKLAAGCVEKDYPLGTIIIEENEPAKEILFIVKEGEIAVSTSAVDPDVLEGSTLLTTFGAGEAFGEVSLIDNNPHSATVRSISDSILLLLPAKHFYEVVEQDKNIGYVVMRNIATLISCRLRNSNFAMKHFGYWGKVDNEECIEQ
ncbi:MAG: cyclic nucleotide-binding domain-containing protein [bacterium]